MEYHLPRSRLRAVRGSATLAWAQGGSFRKLGVREGVSEGGWIFFSTASRPETYEDWEMQGIDRYDLAAIGRVWYLECWARADGRPGRNMSFNPARGRSGKGKQLVMAGTLLFGANGQLGQV